MRKSGHFLRQFARPTASEGTFFGLLAHIVAQAVVCRFGVAADVWEGCDLDSS